MTESLCVILTLLFLTQVVMTNGLETTTTSIYTGKVSSCFLEALTHRTVLEITTGDSGRLECVRQCIQAVSCDTVVHQEFESGSTSCMMLSKERNKLPSSLELPSSKVCAMVHLQPCLNGGRLNEGICVCPEDFTGPACEFSNPNACDVEWMTEPGDSSPDMTVDDKFENRNAKIVIRDNRLNVLSVMKSMDSGVSYYSSNFYGYRYFTSFLFFEKESWNKFAANSQRQYMHAMTDGDVQILRFNGTMDSYTTSRSMESFSFIFPKQTPYVVKRNMPEDHDQVLNDIRNGFELFGSTRISVDEDGGVIVAQLTDRFINTVIGDHFIEPPERVDFKFVLGRVTYLAGFYLANGVMVGGKTDPYSQDIYFNPCWIIAPDEDYRDHLRPISGWRKLGTYLKSGNDVRIKMGSSYHTILETIHAGSSFSFILAPYLSQREPSYFTTAVLEIRSMLSTSGFYESCSHKVERDQIISNAQPQPVNDIQLFVDTRPWKQVFAVFSNSSIAYGSVSDLISGVTIGRDVRIWIKWLQSGVSRFLDTHISSVTDDGKVSTESLVTSRTTVDPEVHLSRRCDLQNILVTSDGHVEVLIFNIQTPGKIEVQKDVLVTWFLA